jgi:hypothetical protein
MRVPFPNGSPPIEIQSGREYPSDTSPCQQPILSRPGQKAGRIELNEATFERVLNGTSLPHSESDASVRKSG